MCVQTQTTETTRILTPGLSGFASVLAKCHYDSQGGYARWDSKVVFTDA